MKEQMVNATLRKFTVRKCFLQGFMNHVTWETGSRGSVGATAMCTSGETRWHVEPAVTEQHVKPSSLEEPLSAHQICRIAHWLLNMGKHLTLSCVTRRKPWTASICTKTLGDFEVAFSCESGAAAQLLCNYDSTPHAITLQITRMGFPLSYRGRFEIYK